MGFERPTENDLDTALSMLMHESRHKLMERVNQIKSDAIEAGALQSSRVVVNAAKAADDIHKEATEQARAVIFDFFERINRSPIEIVSWARPQLENMSNSILGVVPPNGFPEDHQHLTNQYRAVFQQRIDIMLRNVEIGHQPEAGFARAEKVESKEEWISAGEAVRLLKPSLGGEGMAQMSLCKRAHAGLVRSRAHRLIIAGAPRDNVELPAFFWRAEGHAALHQNWRTGDFDTWVKGDDLPRQLRRSAREVHFEAFNISFLRSDVEKLIPPDASPLPAAVAQAKPARNKGGRPKRDFWEELWVEIGRQLYVGDLKPKTQADLEKAMSQWITNNNYEAGDTAVRDRARTLWRAIEKDGN